MKFYDDVFKGRDNYIVRRIETIDNIPINLQDPILTRCTLELEGSNPSFIVDSDNPDHNDVFDWETYADLGLLGISLGIVHDLPEGFGTYRLVIYSADFPSGLDDLKPIYFRVWPLSSG